MNHPNRNWRSRWTIDIPQQEARHHTTGLVVRFSKSGVAGKMLNLDEVSAAMAHTTPIHEQGRVISHLLKQANRRYAETLNQGTNEGRTMPYES